MNQNKKSNGWILCSSKSFPGKFYYFNVLNGETAWTLTEAEVEKTKKQVQYSTIHSNYPEPLTKPPDDNPSQTPTHSQPKKPATTPLGAKPSGPCFGEAIFPIFPPTKDLPNFVWAAVPIRYINDVNIPSFETQKSNRSFAELVKESQTNEDNNRIVVQVHTNNDQYVSKRFVTYNRISNINETDQTKDSNENPFLSSTPSPPIQIKSNILFNKNNHQNIFELTNNAEYNKNNYIKNPKFIFQMINKNSDHEEPTYNFQSSTRETKTFRDAINNNDSITPNKTKFGYGYDTPNQSAHSFDIPNQSAQTFDTPNKTAYGFDNPNDFNMFDTPQETPPDFDKPNFGFNTAKETILCCSETLNKTSYGFDIREKAIHGFSTPKKTTFGIDTPNKTIYGFDTPKKTYGIDTPNKTISGFDTPITTEIQTKIPEKLNKLPENDLRNVLLQRKRKMEYSTNLDENAKKMKASYNEWQASPKKHVTFKLNDPDMSDISSKDFSFCDNEVLESPTNLAVESLSSLRRLGATNDTWYIAVDLDVLLENFEFIDAFIKTEPLCCLLVPYSVYKELTTTSTACDSRARVNSARNVLRRLECRDNRYKVQITVFGSEKLKSTKDQIQSCCIELIRNNKHVVLITNNDVLYKEAKEKRIQVFKINHIQNGVPTPYVTFDIQKVKLQIPNDNCVPNSKENVENFENQLVKRNDQNSANQNIERKTDEKYKKSVQNFWLSDNSVSDFSIVSQKMNIFDKTCKKTQLKSEKRQEIVTSNFFKQMNNVVVTKSITKNGSASKESLFGIPSSKLPENRENNSQKITLKNSASKNIENKRKPTFLEEKQHSISDIPASKKSDHNFGNFIFTKPSSETNNRQISPFKNEKPVSKVSENHANDNNIKNSVSKKAENQNSIFEIDSSFIPITSENHANDNYIKNSVSKKAENQNSIFEIDSSFMPITSKTVDDYLKKFYLKDKMVEEHLKNCFDEIICCLRQIFEDLSYVLKEPLSKFDNSEACVFYNILQKIRKIYGKRQLVRDAIEKLQVLLYKSDCIDKIRRDLLPIEIMQAIGCGLLLVKLLKERIHSEHLIDIEKGLNELIQSIEKPKIFENIETPALYKGDKNEIYDENRINFKRDESDIVQYLKKHYPAWTDFDDETTTSVRQKPEIKIFRTLGKNLNLFKLNRSKIIVEKAIGNSKSSADPNSVQIHENDRTNTVNVEGDDHIVCKNEERDKIPNTNDQKVKKTEMSAFFENFDLEKELQGLKNTEKTEPKIIRLFANDKEAEKTNFDSKNIHIDTQNKLEVLKNTKNPEPKVIRIISNDKAGENTKFDSEMTNIDSKKTDTDPKKTNFDLNQSIHGNTFQKTESGPEVVRKIALIPKYEELFKKYVQNGPITTKTVQNGPITTKIVKYGLENSLSDTENMTNEDHFLENEDLFDKVKKFEIFKNINLVDNFDFIENSIKCYSISDEASISVIDNGIENNLRAAISIFFKEIRSCFHNIHNFIDSSFNKIKKSENKTEVKSIKNTATKIHGHILRIIEKLSSYKEAKGENMNFSFSILENDENSTDLYKTKCRQLSSLCIVQGKILEKMVTELCNYNH